jgi:hypothetical protein
MRRQGRTLSALTASFPDDEDRNGSRNFVCLAVQPPDAVGEYFIEFSRRETCNIYIFFHFVQNFSELFKLYETFENVF